MNIVIAAVQYQELWLNLRKQVKHQRCIIIYHVTDLLVTCTAHVLTLHNDNPRKITTELRSQNITFRVIFWSQPFKHQPQEVFLSLINLTKKQTK